MVKSRWGACEESLSTASPLFVDVLIRPEYSPPTTVINSGDDDWFLNTNDAFLHPSACPHVSGCSGSNAAACRRAWLDTTNAFGSKDFFPDRVLPPLRPDRLSREVQEWILRTLGNPQEGPGRTVNFEYALVECLILTAREVGIGQ